MPNIKVNGINLYYEYYGPKTAPVLVLNNGIFMNCRYKLGLSDGVLLPTLSCAAV